MGCIWKFRVRKKRALWWDNLVEKYHTSNRAEVARLIHPQRIKGDEALSNLWKKTQHSLCLSKKIHAKKINDLGYSFKSYDLTIDEIFEEIFK